MNCLRCHKLRVGGQLHDELYCTANRPPVRMFMEDLGRGDCGHAPESKHQLWTKAEDVWLRLNYQRRGGVECAEFLQRSLRMTCRRARELGLGRWRRRLWTGAETEYLREHWRGGGEARKRDLAADLNRTPGAIGAQASKLGITRRKNRRWSLAELRYLRNHIWRESLTLIARALGRTRSAVQLVKRRRGIPVRRFWTMRRVMELFRTRNDHLFAAAIASKRLPAVARRDEIGRITWQVRPKHVMALALQCAHESAGNGKRGSLCWLTIDPARLDALRNECDGAAGAEELLERLRHVVCIRVPGAVIKESYYIAEKLRLAGHQGSVPSGKDYLLTDAPPDAIERLFIPKLRARMQIARHNG